ncbi:hypothetical protein MUGA111182_07690 [Mucilaginibacter galii]|uniref:Uncharacterized protein n=1 Tax=Mucilaginibacter galii TaxID=2005073 RepID=A0A917JCZ9_9SPHI|nr:hypothetical protein [Mucilaginibacter galii]GGI51449.1 hypothetical protein GCM10011425_26610 [Mucilaginibacter galii]
METFYIDAELSRGLTRIQVDEIQPEHWDMPATPQFMIEFYMHGSGFMTLTIQLESGIWYDRLTRLSEDDLQLLYYELDPNHAWDPNYQCPLSKAELKNIGMVISNYMVTYLTIYMGAFIPQFRTPTLN